jgi:hypothetical protein
VIQDQSAQPRRNFIPPHGTIARLHIDRVDVGSVVVEGFDSPWSFGRFTPSSGFAHFANFFGQWSLLMHEDEQFPLHKATSAALAEAERQMDALHIEIHYPEHNIQQSVRELNIDGNTAEWRQV